VDSEKLSIDRQQAVNTFPWQPKHDPLPTLTEPSLGNSLLNILAVGELLDMMFSVRFVQRLEAI
jgi:hypothetical protein